MGTSSRYADVKKEVWSTRVVNKSGCGNDVACLSPLEALNFINLFGCHSKGRVAEVGKVLRVGLVKPCTFPCLDRPNGYPVARAFCQCKGRPSVHCITLKRKGLDIPGTESVAHVFINKLFIRDLHFCLKGIDPGTDLQAKMYFRNPINPIQGPEVLLAANALGLVSAPLVWAYLPLMKRG